MKNHQGTRRRPCPRLLARIARYLWSGPNTLLGLAAALASLSVPSVKEGILLCRSDRGFARWFLTRRGYCAITLGHLVLVTIEPTCSLLRHETVHVRQGERWGPLFIPAYLTAMAAAGLRRQNPYWDNPFEKEARERESLFSPPRTVWHNSS